MINFNEIQENLTSDDIIQILSQCMGVDRYIDRGDCIVFPTVCHNIDSDDASMKLYYYKNNTLFHCYTDCGESFNIFQLFKKYYTLHGIEYTFYNDILLKITTPENLYQHKTKHNKYQPRRDRYKKRDREVDLPTHPIGILNMFQERDAAEWIEEGITSETMKTFNIKFSSVDNSIIIPHFNIKGDLVGIRGRMLNEIDVETFGKYLPVQIEGKWYSHPLSCNLYGLELNKENIKSYRKMILFEGEKSVLLYESLYGRENNISCAVCGSNLNKTQIKIAVNHCGVNEIIIAFDKEYQNYPSLKAENYFNKLRNLSQKYKILCNFSFVYDTENKINYKESPIDQGKEVFNYLLKKRVKVDFK